MTTLQIKEQAETIEATVSQDNANLQEAVQALASLLAALSGKVNNIIGEMNTHRCD